MWQDTTKHMQKVYIFLCRKFVMFRLKFEIFNINLHRTILAHNVDKLLEFITFFSHNSHKF